MTGMRVENRTSVPDEDLVAYATDSVLSDALEQEGARRKMVAGPLPVYRGVNRFSQWRHVSSWTDDLAEAWEWAGPDGIVLQASIDPISALAIITHEDDGDTMTEYVMPAQVWCRLDGLTLS